jgi:two-component system chemotaxis response regulator CheB
MVRVLIADDSRLTRTVLRDLLGRDREIEVIGEAGDGRQAVEMTCRLKPDLVLMDVLMPVMDGLAAVIEIMACCPTPILVLSANVDPTDSRSAFNAIRHGALDVMEKPAGVVSSSFGDIAAALIDKIKSLARVRVIHHFRRPRQQVTPGPPPATDGRSLLAIGASTGGPKAVMRLVKELPADFPGRVLVVQHIARGFAAGFAEWLDRECPCRVRLAADGDALEPGVVLVAPNDHHMIVQNGRLRLLDSSPVNSCRPSVDVLFHSLAGDGLGEAVVAVLLTGMGHDGAAGLAVLRGAGSFNIAQDEATSAVYGMPRAAIQLGAVHRVLPLPDISEAVLRLFRNAKEL